MGEEKFIGMKIRALRKEAGLDVDAFGEGVGRSGKTVSAWETGRNVPSAEMLISICRFFGVSISYFYPPDVGSGSVDLSKSENELVTLYRNIEPAYRETLLETARAFSALTEKDGRNAEEIVGIGAVDAVSGVAQ